jgi:hypothetical protein
MLIDWALGIGRVLVELPERAAGGFGGGHAEYSSSNNGMPASTRFAFAILRMCAQLPPRWLLRISRSSILVMFRTPHGGEHPQDLGEFLLDFGKFLDVIKEARSP